MFSSSFFMPKYSQEVMSMFKDEILESYKDEDNKEVDAEKKVDEILKELDDNNVVNSQQNITENKEDLTTETPEVKPNNSSNDVTDKPEEIEDEDYIAAKDFVNDILYNQPTEEEIKFNEFKQKVENMLKRDIDLDKLSAKKNRELDKELKKLEDDIELDDFGKYTEEDVIKIALFKDIYKAELFEPYAKNVKNEITGQWESVIAYKYSENRAMYGDLPFNSFMTARKFIELTDEQIQAIMHANSNNSYGGDIHEIMRRCPLVALTRMADIAAYYLD